MPGRGDGEAYDGTVIHTGGRPLTISLTMDGHQCGTPVNQGEKPVLGFSDAVLVLCPDRQRIAHGSVADGPDAGGVGHGRRADAIAGIRPVRGMGCYG